MAERPPAGAPIPEIAGPREESLVEAARKLAARSGNGLRIEEGDWGEPDGGLYRDGAALPSPHAPPCRAHVRGMARSGLVSDASHAGSSADIPRRSTTV